MENLAQKDFPLSNPNEKHSAKELMQNIGKLQSFTRYHKGRITNEIPEISENNSNKNENKLETSALEKIVVDTPYI